MGRPFSALPAAVADIPAEDVGTPDVRLLSPVLGALAVLAWVAGLFGLGAALLRCRGLT